MTPMDQDYDTDPQDTNLPIAHRTQAAPLGSGVPLTSRGRRASEQLPTPPTSAAGSSMTLTPAAHPSLGIVQGILECFMYFSVLTNDWISAKYRPG